MDNRKWESGASASPPAAPASPSSGYPTNGDPLASVPPTVPGAHWFYQIGEELRAVLTAAGITPSTASTAQLLEAIQRLIDAQSGNYALDTGAANAYVVALSPAITAYTDGMTVRVKAVNANTGASTLNAGGGVVSLVNDVGGALGNGDVPAGGIFAATYIASAGKFYITSMVQSQGDARYAALIGLATQVFSVAAATDAAHAVRADQIQKQSVNFFATTGTAGAYVLTPTPAVAAYTEGLSFDVEVHLNNNSAATVNISGLGPVAIKRELPDGSLVGIAQNELIQYHIYRFTYDNTNACVVVRDCKAKRTKMITGTRDMTLASGSVAYTGVGFKPSKITAYSCINATRIKSVGVGSSGTDCMAVYAGSTTGYDSIYSGRLITQLSTTGGADQSASIVSMDSDGFTLNWTKTGTPAAETALIRFFCEE